MYPLWKSIIFCARKGVSLFLLVAIFVNLTSSSVAMYDPEQELSDQSTRRQVAVARRHTGDFFPEWAPIAGGRLIGLSQTIYVKWALSQLSSTDLAIAELKGPSQDFFYTLGVGPLYALEDLVAQERAQLLLARQQRDDIAIETHVKNIGVIYRTGNALGLISAIPA